MFIYILPIPPVYGKTENIYRCNSFIVDLRHKFTVRNMNEIPVFVQSSELKVTERDQLRKSTLKEFHLYITTALVKVEMNKGFL